MKFDDVLREIGEFGPYQKRLFFLAVIPAVLVAFETMSVVFIFYRQPHRCAIPGFTEDTYITQNTTHSLMINTTIPRTNGHWHECHVYKDATYDVTMNGNTSTLVDYVIGYRQSENSIDVVNRTKSKCSRWVYDYSLFESTVTSDFDVVCENSVQRAVSNMISEIGTMAGMLVCGLLADRFGRKISFYVGGVSLLAGGFGIAFTQNFITFNVCRLIIGVARMCVFVNGLILALELIGPSRRTIVSVVIHIFWCLGLLLLPLLAYFIRNWRYLEISLSIPAIFLLFYWWLLPESPRWLASRGREEEAIKVLEKIARSNKTQLPRVEAVGTLLEKETSLSFRNIFKSWELIRRMLIIFSNWFVIVVVYYGLTLNITNLSGDIFVNFTINVVLEGIAYGLTYIVLLRVGRRPAFSCTMIVAGLACVASVLPVLVGAPGWIVVVLSMSGRFLVCMAFAIIYQYAPELFPTILRSSAIGVGVTFARTGSIISPYIADLGIYVSGNLQTVIPLIVMGTPALFVGVLSLWLPETRKRRLPETLEDVDNQKSDGGCINCFRKASSSDNVDVEMNETFSNGKMLG